VEDAESALRRLGVTADFASRTEIATLTIEALLRAVAARWSLPRVVRVDPYPFAAQFSGDFRLVPALYMYAEDAIVLNPLASYWSHPELMARREYEFGQSGTDDPLGVIYHELGHALHLRGAPPRYSNSDWSQEVVAALRDQVSDNGLLNPSEFVAEVFSGMMSGRAFGVTVMAWYDRFEGPRR
jgi:hypothetical protein